MKILLFGALALGLHAHAETVQCPAQFPTKDLLIEGGRVQPARLSFAYVHSGDRYSDQLLQSPQSKRVRGGWNIQYGSMPSDRVWLVCLYGGTEWSGLDRISPGTIQWWGLLAKQGGTCSLSVRESKLPGSLSDWKATASCEP